MCVYEAEVLRLRGELQRLKSMMLAHRDCPVTRQQQKMLTGIAWCSVKPGTHWRQTRLLPKPVSNGQHSRLSLIRWTLLPMLSTLWPVLVTNRQQLEFDSLSRWTLLPTRWTFMPIWSTLHRYGRLCRQYSRLSRQCVRGQSDKVDFQQSRPCWIQLCRQCVPGSRTRGKQLKKHEEPEDNLHFLYTRPILHLMRLLVNHWSTPLSLMPLTV